MRILAPLLLLALAACTTPPVDRGADPRAAAGVAASGEALTAHHWTLESARTADGTRIDALLVRPAQPLQLDFEEGRLRVANACNGIGGSYRLDGGRLQVGPLMATKRACADPAVSALDAAISSRLEGGARLALEGGARPVLVLHAANGDVLRFAGTPTTASRHGSPGEVVFMEVAADTVPCTGGSGGCLRVRDVHYDGQGLRQGAPGQWRVLERPIEGFVHEPGSRAVLRVRRFATPGSGEALVLDMVVESGSGGG